MLSRFKDFDFYRKIPKDLTETTTHGTVLSICASLFMLVLFIAELWAFLSVNVTTTILIDPNPDQLLRINFNLTLLEVPCEYAVIDVVDVLGTREDNVTKNVNSWQVDEGGSRRMYAGKNVKQIDLMHDVHHDLDELTDNGIHALVLTDKEFLPHLESHDVTFVNFFAPWCIWCQRLEPVWEAFAEKVAEAKIPVSIVKVDCVAEQHLCMNQKIQAFPNLRLFKKTEPQAPDYRSDRTVAAFVGFLEERLALHDKVAGMSHEELQEHKEELALNKDDHPGCQMAGFLLVNRVPGNFHIEARSKHHNLNPKMANLSHVIHHLSFGPVLPPKLARKLEVIPKEIFSIKSTIPMNDNVYVNSQLHQVSHHFIKVVSTQLEVSSRYKGKDAILAYQMVESSQTMKYEDDEIPEARFTYDISPMAVQVSRKGKQWYEFVTSMCALIGGTFTVVGLLSGFLNIIFKAKKL